MDLEKFGQDGSASHGRRDLTIKTSGIDLVCREFWHDPTLAGRPVDRADGGQPDGGRLPSRRAYHIA